MSHPTDDELVDLATGDSVDAELTAHVAACATCTASVQQLRRTVRLASSPGTGGWQVPDRTVWDRVTAQIDADTDAASGLASAPPSDPPSDPAADVVSEGGADTDTSTASGSDADASPRRHDAPGVPSVTPPTAYAPEPVPSDATVTPITASAARATRRRAAAWGAALVAASLVVGLLAGRAIWAPDDSGRVSQVALETLDTRQREGEATVVRAKDGLDLSVVTDRPLDAGDGYLEVWLLNTDGKRMVSVGVLRPGESGTFPISQDLIDQGYVVVDVSKEQFDDKPAHSGDSLLRGQLPA